MLTQHLAALCIQHEIPNSVPPDDMINASTLLLLENHRVQSTKENTSIEGYSILSYYSHVFSGLSGLSSSKLAFFVPPTLGFLEGLSVIDLSSWSSGVVGSSLQGNYRSHYLVWRNRSQQQNAYFKASIHHNTYTQKVFSQP